MAGTIGLVQNDIKRVLAYSTVSQLGYMFLAMGVGAFGAGIFHLYTHAFFKALLFLGSGAVIHALHGEQDIRNMGGLKKAPADHLLDVPDRRRWRSPACPLLAGFFSKDEILFETFAEGHTMLWVDRRADVAADRDLHVPAGVPDVPRRAPARRARSGARARLRTDMRQTTSHASTRHARLARTRIRLAPARRAAGDGARADRAGDRLGARPARSAFRTRSAAQRAWRLARARRSPHRAWPVKPRVAKRLPRQAQAAEAEHEALELTLMVVSSADRARRHRPRVLRLAEAPRDRRRRWRASSAALHRLLLNKYYVDEVYDATIVQPIKVVSQRRAVARLRRAGDRRRGQRRRRRS